MEEKKTHLHEQERILEKQSDLQGGHGVGTITQSDMAAQTEQGAVGRKELGSSAWVNRHRKGKNEEPQEMGNGRDVKQALTFQTPEASTGLPSPPSSGLVSARPTPPRGTSLPSPHLGAPVGPRQVAAGTGSRGALQVQGAPSSLDLRVRGRGGLNPDTPQPPLNLTLRALPTPRKRGQLFHPYRLL